LNDISRNWGLNDKFHIETTEINTNQNYNYVFLDRQMLVALHSFRNITFFTSKNYYEKYMKISLLEEKFEKDLQNSDFVFIKYIGIHEKFLYI
jgi:hypothetical protein